MRGERLFSPSLLGLRDPKNRGFLNTSELISSDRLNSIIPGTNTVLGVVTTNTYLTKVETGRLASQACLGLARTIRPAHTSYDGDTIFALSRGSVQAHPDQVGILAAECVARAVVKAVEQAWSLGGVPAACDLSKD